MSPESTMTPATIKAIPRAGRGSPSRIAASIASHRRRAIAAVATPARIKGPQPPPTPNGASGPPGAVRLRRRRRRGRARSAATQDTSVHSLVGTAVQDPVRSCPHPRFEMPKSLVRATRRTSPAGSCPGSSASVGRQRTSAATRNLAAPVSGRVVLGGVDRRRDRVRCGTNRHIAANDPWSPSHTRSVRRGCSCRRGSHDPRRKGNNWIASTRLVAIRRLYLVRSDLACAGARACSSTRRSPERRRTGQAMSR